MYIIAIDPGCDKSAIVQWDGQRVLSAEILENEMCLSCLKTFNPEQGLLVLEMVSSYGMPVGREVFETVFWIGRFFESWKGEKQRVYRRDVKLHHCNSAKAKDSNIRQALVDKYGDKGSKNQPGITYNLRKDLWAAFALATYVSEISTATLGNGGHHD